MAFYLNCALIISVMNMVLFFSQNKDFRIDVPRKVYSFLFPSYSFVYCSFDRL